MAKTIDCSENTAMVMVKTIDHSENTAMFTI